MRQNRTLLRLTSPQVTFRSSAIFEWSRPVCSVAVARIRRRVRSRSASPNTRLLIRVSLYASPYTRLHIRVSIGTLKKRVPPEGVTINIGEDAPAPRCPMPGHTFLQVCVC
jgi:hypothetical protein